MGKARRTRCFLCPMGEPETLFHWQQDRRTVCPRFHDARTKVYDDIYSVIRSHLLEGKFTTYKETRIGSDFTNIFHEDDSFESRSPTVCL
jgi:hypothetical protein